MIAAFPHVGRPARTIASPERGHDGALIRRCLRGEERAWHELVDRYGRLIYSIARRCRLSDSECDDVHQEVFLILHRKLHTLTNVSRLAAWIITTTKRECWRVRRRREVSLEVIPDRSSHDLPGDEELSAIEERRLVRAAMSRLDERSRAILEALFQQNGSTSYESIANRLDIPLGSIGPIRARCFRKLETIMCDVHLHRRMKSDDRNEFESRCISEGAASLS